jgi:tetratricopeptide (TPR) repeat protein
MFIRGIPRETKAVGWIEILAIAIALLAALATVVGAADGVRRRPVPPATLPQDIAQRSKPMAADLEPLRETDLGQLVWRAIGLHADEKFDEAMQVWKMIDLPASTHVWKLVAQAQASIATGRLEEAEQLLSTAADENANHPVVHYFLAVLRLEQAHIARDWPDQATPDHFRMASTRPMPVVPNTRSMYELVASQEFERAIAGAVDVNFDESLIPDASVSVPLEPTVGDLLLALRAENFVAKAHHALSFLYLKRGSLELAEGHLDEAVGAGMESIDGYSQLAAEYRARGELGKSVWANLKALRYDSRTMNSGIDLLETVREALIGP